MAGWHHWIDGRGSEWTPGIGNGQGGLVCCDSWGRKELDTTEGLNWTQLKAATLGKCQKCGDNSDKCTGKRWIFLSWRTLWKFFYWNISDLQCVSFRHTAKWFSYIHTHINIHIYVYIYSFSEFSIIVYYKILNLFPCAILEIPTGPYCLFCI